jgi:hypothetical protein
MPVPQCSYKIRGRFLRHSVNLKYSRPCDHGMVVARAANELNRHRRRRNNQPAPEARCNHAIRQYGDAVRRAAAAHPPHPGY